MANGSDPANLVSDYGNKTAPRWRRRTLTGAVAVLLQRFPYMTSAQIADVLKTTATDMGAPGIDALYGWG